MTEEEYNRLMNRIDEALLSDDMDTFYELAIKMPVPPEIAKSIRLGLGSEYLKNAGIHLLEATEEDGKKWLS